MATPATVYEPAARLFDQYGAQLYRFCLARLRSREEAEDAVQSTFLRACRALDRGLVPRHEAAWLYKIAHNVCIDRLEALARQRKIIPLHDREDLELELVATQEHPDEIAELPGALAGLPPNLREALLLREFRGLSYAEIAQQMDTTVPAVETLLFRARREVAKMLGDGRRRRIALLDGLGALLSRFLPIAPAKLATGAALLAIGGAGVGAAVELDGATTPKPHRTAAPLIVGAAIGPRSPASRPAPAASRPAAQRRSFATHAGASTATTTGGAPIHAHAAVAPDDAPAPVHGHEQPVSAPAAAGPAPSAAPAGNPVTTAAATTTAALPQVTAPPVTVTVPSVTVTVPALPPVEPPPPITVTTPPLPPVPPLP